MKPRLLITLLENWVQYEDKMNFIKHIPITIAEVKLAEREKRRTLLNGKMKKK